MSKEKINEIFLKLKNKMESYKKEVRFPDGHPETHKYREYFVEAEALYETLSTEDKEEIQEKMSYIRMHSPRSHTRR